MSSRQEGKEALSLKTNQAFMCHKKGGVAKEDEWQGKMWSQAVLVAGYLVANEPPSFILTSAGTHSESSSEEHHAPLSLYVKFLYVPPVQVMQVVREQITRTLSSKPTSLELFKNKVNALNYSEILKLRQTERLHQEETLAPPVL